MAKPLPKQANWDLDAAIKKRAPMKASEIKNFNFTQKKEHRTMADIEKDLWKNNIIATPRKRVDPLDITNEDFRAVKTPSIDGSQVNPSTFNIFRDSLKKNSIALHERLVQNLPDMNLDDVTSNSSNSESENENDVVPLDFRTALVKSENKIVIQAKPLHFKTVEEDLKDLEEEQNRKANGEDEFLNAVKKEAFAEDDDQVLMIDPGMDTETIFGDVKLPCEKVPRINNSTKASVIPEALQEQ